MPPADPFFAAITQLLNPRPEPSRRLVPDYPFPLEAFPDPLAVWLTATAYRARVPVALVAMPFLALTGGLIGRRLRLEVGPGWHERPALWVALVAPTGAGKTPALAAARAPFLHLQREDLARWQDSRYRHNTVPDTILTATGGVDDLARILQRNPGCTVVRDELYGLIRSLDRHQGQERQAWLSLWSGEPLLPVDPRLPGVPEPVVSLVGGLQPGLLSRVRDRAQDGFLERFLLVYPETPLLRWSAPDALAAPDDDGILSLLRTLAALPGTGPSAGAVVAFDPDAAARWARWVNGNIEQHLATGGPVAAYYRKLPAHAARLALILHALWHPDDPTVPITRDTLLCAILLVEYVRIHVHRAAGVLGIEGRLHTPGSALAHRIREALATAPGDWLTRTELQVRLARPDLAQFDDAITHLLERGVIERSTHRPEGGPRAAIHYRLLPPNIDGGATSTDQPLHEEQETGNAGSTA
jgi:hypothetical protein